MELCYKQIGDQFYPELELHEQTDYEIGKYGNLHLAFLKNHRRGTYTTLLTEGRLNEYLHSIDEQAAADLDQEKLNEKRMSIRPKKEEEAQKRISDLYGYCQDSFFRASKNAVAKRLGEQPADIEKQKPNKQTVPTPSWLRGRKKKDDRDER